MTRADDQLMRLLQAFPLMADEPQLTLDALAERLNTDTSTLLRDFAALDRDDVPAGWVDAVAVHIGANDVSMRSAHFKRPIRLIRPEMAALDLGLGLLSQEMAADERTAVYALRRKMQDVAAPTAATVVDRRRRETAGAGDTQPAHSPELAVEAAPDATFASFVGLQQALERSCIVELTYQRADGTEAGARRVRPYAMVRAAANLYLVGFCEQAHALRMFRLDRVVHTVTTDEPCEVPANFSVESVLQQGHVFSGSAAHSEMLAVRYSAAVARWIAEREPATVQPDGAVLVEYPLADADWAVRHVLHYGPDAVILSPASVRAAVKRALQRMLE